MTLNFNKTLNRLDQTVTNSFERNLKAKVVKIETSVNSTQSKAMRMMARMISNSSGVPNLGRDTPVWKKLNNEYVENKKNNGFSAGFFERTGRLRSDLSKLSSDSILGTPLVGLLGRTSGNQTTVISRRGQRTPITRAPGGRLTKLSVTKQAHTILVDPYPAITESIDKDLDERKYFKKNISMKLRSFQGQRLRPIFAQFLSWYMKTEIRVAIRRAL